MQTMPSWADAVPWMLKTVGRTRVWQRYTSTAPDKAKEQMRSKSILYKEKGVSRSKRRQNFCPDQRQVYSETRSADERNYTITQAKTKGPQLSLNETPGPMKGRGKPQVRLVSAIKVVRILTLRPFGLQKGPG